MTRIIPSRKPEIERERERARDYKVIARSSMVGIFGDNLGPCSKRGAGPSLPTSSKLEKTVYKIIALT